MDFVEKQLYIKSRTTGFASPAESYVDKRLDLNELIVSDIKTTFYFKYDGPDMDKIKKGSVLVIDRNQRPKFGDLVLIVHSPTFKIETYCGQENLWGKITWSLNKL